MISTLGYHAPSSPRGSKTRFSTGVPSPFQPQSSLLVSCRRPSIPLSPGLLPLLSFPSASQPQSDITGFGCAPVTRWSPPVHQLPVEILCDIFSYCEAQSQSRYLGPKVTISHVCRRWRSVILCMPLLWTSIHVGKSVTNALDRVSSYLRRSASCPISLSIASNVDSPFNHCANNEALWSVIRPCAQQLQSLRLEVQGSAQDLIRYMTEWQFPMLRALDLRVVGSPPAIVNELIAILVRRSSISSFIWRAGEFPTSLSCSRLTSLDLCGVYSLEDVYSILRRCRELRHLQLDAVAGDHSISCTAEISLAKLETISIQSLAKLENLFSLLQLPVLRKIHLRYRMPQDVPRDWKPLSSMLIRSGCRLETLVLHDANIREVDLLQYFRLPGMACLTDLQLLDPPVANLFLHALVVNGALHPILPGLRRLCLSDCQSSDGVLRGVLFSRLLDTQQTYRGIQHVEVGLSGPHDADIEGLLLLQRNGVDIKFWSNEL